MRFIYLTLVILISAVIFIFTFQNLSTATVSFLHWQMRTPLSITMLVIYFLGMLTGGSLVSLIKSWVRGSTRRPQD
jgi:lipopolysaccharide assembly protein A